jgi:virginiamycin B lyase
VSRLTVATVALALVAGCSTSSGERASPSPTGSPSGAPSGSPSGSPSGTPRLQEYPVPAGSFPHDVAVAADGTVWYTAQHSGELGRLGADGKVVEIPLGSDSHPHGVALAPDGGVWVTDGGRNELTRVDPRTTATRRYPLPRPAAGAHTPVVAADGTVWFTGNAGYYGRLRPGAQDVEMFEAPGGSGPYGITVTPSGDVWYASLNAHHIARVDPRTGRATTIAPPTKRQGARRVWTDSKDRLWVSQWHAGQVAVYDPAARTWREWKLPGARPQAYAVYVDDRDVVWLSDFGANALVRFDPETERFTSYPLPSNPGNVRQIHGRPGEVWGAESAADKLVVLRLR